MMRDVETIVALASGAPPVGVAIIRVSGPLANMACQQLTGRLPVPRLAALCALKDAQAGLLDRCLVVRFAGPNSFTGEDVVEFHCHGGRAVVAAVLDRVLQIDGVRLAHAGEFTRRAFDHGKLDLSAAEGLADLINAETEAQRRQALSQMDGALARLVESWRGELLKAIALAEAQIDFPDEDLPAGLGSVLVTQLERVAATLDIVIANGRSARHVRDGLRVVILGAPNAGKSSLLNALIGSDVAIVAPTPGTTRDVVEARLQVAGHLVVFSDTAGLRDTADPVEAEGVRRARARGAHADLRLLVAETAADFDALEADAQQGDIRVWSKSDLRPESSVTGHPAEAISLSSETGQGLELLLQRLEESLATRSGGVGDGGFTQLRHLEAGLEARACLERALVPDLQDVELVAEELRLAARALGRITGRIGVDDVLDSVFSQFCIGK